MNEKSYQPVSIMLVIKSVTKTISISKKGIIWGGMTPWKVLLDSEGFDSNIKHALVCIFSIFPNQSMIISY